jgi:hypothetical protein
MSSSVVTEGDTLLISDDLKARTQVPKFPPKSWYSVTVIMLVDRCQGGLQDISRQMSALPQIS